MKQETKRKIEISNLHEFADSLILIDNRIDRCKKHQASTIVLIAISAVICGADTWNSIEDFGKSKESFFAAKLSNFNGIPSHDTFNRFFSALDPLKFEESYRQWVQSILKCYSGHIAIDGKTIRGAYESEQDKRHRKQGVLPDSNTGKYKLHVISAFATELGISLGQLCTQEKENEIVVIPELLDMLCIKDCIITIDALGCQRTIAEKVIKGEGDYIFIVKDNQPKLKEIVLSVTEMMEGNIAVESELDVGTTFTVTIPFELDSNYKEAYALENVDFSKSLSGLKVLLVEDNELNMEIAKFILENAELESITMRKEVRD